MNNRELQFISYMEQVSEGLARSGPPQTLSSTELVILCSLAKIGATAVFIQEGLSADGTVLEQTAEELQQTMREKFSDDEWRQGMLNFAKGFTTMLSNRFSEFAV